MKLQLRYLCEIAKRDLSFSNAAAALHTLQPQHYLRGFAFDFIQTVAPGIDRAAVEKAAAASITNRNGS